MTVPRLQAVVVLDVEGDRVRAWLELAPDRGRVHHLEREVASLEVDAVTAIGEVIGFSQLVCRFGGPRRRYEDRAAAGRCDVSLGAAARCSQVPAVLESEEGVAHPYVDVAHRAALLYSFALLLVATFVELSGWGSLVNLLAAGALALYFFAAVAGYTVHGWQRDTENQFRDPVAGLHNFMITLIVAEIGGWLVLVAGFIDGQLL